MSPEVNPEDAWDLIKKLDFYERLKKTCSDVDILQLLKEGVSPEEIINLIVERIINED